MATHTRSTEKSEEKKDPKELFLIDYAIVCLLQAIHSEVEPESIKDPEASRIFLNLCCMQVDYCRSIRSLSIDGHILASMSILRTLLEVTTCFSWASKDFPKRKAHYLEQKSFPGIKNMMDDLGWSDCYDKLYRPLCEFTHASYNISESQREIIDIKNISPADHDRILAIIPTQCPNGELSNVFVDLDLTPERLLSIYGTDISARTFDFVVTMLMRGSGEYADSAAWFPKKRFMDKWDKYAATFNSSKPILWYRERSRLIVYHNEGWFQHDPTKTENATDG